MNMAHISQAKLQLAQRKPEEAARSFWNAFEYTRVSDQAKAGFSHTNAGLWPDTDPDIKPSTSRSAKFSKDKDQPMPPMSGFLFHGGFCGHQERQLWVARPLHILGSSARAFSYSTDALSKSPTQSVSTASRRQTVLFKDESLTAHFSYSNAASLHWPFLSNNCAAAKHASLARLGGSLLSASDSAFACGGEEVVLAS